MSERKSVVKENMMKLRLQDFRDLDFNFPANLIEHATPFHQPSISQTLRTQTLLVDPQMVEGIP